MLFVVIHHHVEEKESRLMWSTDFFVWRVVTHKPAEENMSFCLHCLVWVRVSTAKTLNTLIVRSEVGTSGPPDAHLTKSLGSFCTHMHELQQERRVDSARGPNNNPPYGVARGVS